MAGTNDSSSDDAKVQAEEGPRKTPFPHPDAIASVPPAGELTTEQTTAYNSLLNIVSTWTTIPAPDSPSGEQSPLTEGEQMWLTRECLLRYIRAAKWSVAGAQTRLLATLQWRRSYGITALPDRPTKLTPDYISIENETGKQWIIGYDNAGRPCLYLNPSRQNTKRSDRQIEHLVFMLERTVDLMPPGQESLALLINFAESSSGQNASLSQGRQTLSILQNHYPERLGRALLCNVPWFMWTFLKMITPFIDPVTKQKIIYEEPIKSHVPPQQLIVSYGGDLEFDYDHETYWPALNALAAQRREDMTERWIKGGKRIGESELYMRGGTAKSVRDETAVAEKAEKKETTGTDEKLKKTVSIVAGAKGEEDISPPKNDNPAMPPAVPKKSETIDGAAA